MSVSKQVKLQWVRIRYSVLSLLSPSYAAYSALKLFSTPRKAAIPDPPLMREAEKLSVISNGLELKGYRWGKATGNRILILHGFGSAAAKFETYINPLLENGYEVTAFDAQAHGKSEGTTITLPEYITGIETVYNRFGPFNAYIAHSLGGSAVTHFLEKVNPGPDVKVVLIAPSTEVASLITNFSGLLQLKSPVKEKLLALIQERTGYPVDYFSVTRAMGMIRASVLWIHDRDDSITPFADAEKVTDLGLKHVIFMATNGLGHNKIYRDEAVKHRILEFL